MVLRIFNGTVALGAATAGTISEEKGYGTQRLVLSITNLNAIGGNDLFVSMGDEAAANKGRLVSPQATVIWSTDAGYRPPNEQVRGYSAGATNVAIYEEIAQKD